MTVSSVKQLSTSSRIDSFRERELYRYYQPNPAQAATTEPSTLCAHAASSPDTTLTALAQLCAIRLNASRSMISVIGKETQYFIAESTKSLNLSDSQRCEVEGDGLWIGCTDVSKQGRLCEKTIELPPIPGGYPTFTVTDLSKDDRFNQLPFVTGSPFFRFYSGTPLTTKRGVNIGSLFILDDKVRPKLTTDQEAFLGVMAKTVMKHLESEAEAAERKKIMRMSQGLNAFVEGKSGLDPEVQGPTPSRFGDLDDLKDVEYRSSKASRFMNGTSGHSASTNDISAAPAAAPSSPRHISPRSKTLSSVPGHVQQTVDSAANSDTSDSNDAARDDVDSAMTSEDLDTGYRTTFKRAANLLHISLDIQHNNGGVVFLDNTTGFTERKESAITSPNTSDETSAGEDLKDTSFQPSSTPHSLEKHNSSSFETNNFGDPLGKRIASKPAGVLASSTGGTVNEIETKESKIVAFNSPSESLLQDLIRQYPRGRLWSFDEDGFSSSSEDDLVFPIEARRRSDKVNQAKQRQLSALQNHFPGVRQLLFAPLWDAGLARWYSGCFCWTNSSQQVFSREAELNFLLAFNNSVMAEISRQATVAADQQKGDFIGSISHELRSPLHGILASAEFLSETSCDAFQSSLVDTIDSCGRTLLDTINHILDFSKINSFERNWRDLRKPNRRPTNPRPNSSGRTPMLQSTIDSAKAPPLMNIYAITDIAAICEEVVEGVYAGQIFQNISSSDITDVTPGSRGRTSERGLASGGRSLLGGSPEQLTKVVDVILDIAQGDFTFTTQPGALKRVIMNIFGNALKYTEKGSIVVRLSMYDLDSTNTTAAERENGKMIEIKVIDTGRGISDKYLRTRLYTPFSQESTLAPGTGLGLSIVKSILNMLGGSIDIRSQVGQGTEVTVKVPLLRVSENETPVTTPSTSTSFEGQQDGPMGALQAQCLGKTAFLYGADFETRAKLQGIETARVLRTYVSKWFGLEVLPSTTALALADVIFVDEKDLPALLANGSMRAPIIVLCSTSSRHYQTTSHVDVPGVMEFVSKPFGPFKLAKALRISLEKSQDASKKSRQDQTLASEKAESCGVETMTPAFETLTLKSENREKTPTKIQSNGMVTASETSNAHRFVGAMSGGGGEPASEAAQDFPFPTQEAQSSSTQNKGETLFNRPRRESSKRPDLTQRFTDPQIKHPVSNSSAVTETGELTLSNGVKSTSISKEKSPARENERRPPRLLLVDDNKINLRLLQTYMKKRKYSLVDSAEDGLLAVQAATAHEQGYDIIFMDISMPVMNGFEATRAIRAIEENRRRNKATVSTEGGNPPTSALIIALTGLASSRDQSEAFTSGVDLFMTKPVSFKEVGRLLDNWEERREP